LSTALKVLGVIALAPLAALVILLCASGWLDILFR
jgi:hypothetical protein